jgi:hypothetical protein
MGGGGVDDMVRDGVGRVLVSAIGGLVSFYDILIVACKKLRLRM